MKDNIKAKGEKKTKRESRGSTLEATFCVLLQVALDTVI